MQKFLIFKNDFEEFIHNNHISFDQSEISVLSLDFLSFDSSSRFYKEHSVLLKKSNTQFFRDINKTLDSYKMLVCDMDSTLIQNECIDEIADLIYLKKEIAEITEETMLGHLSFDDSIRKRVSLLKGVNVEAFEKIVNEKIKLQPYVIEWIDYVKRFNLKTIIVSGGFTYFVEFVRNTLRMDHAYANELQIVDGVLTGKLCGDIINAEKKANIIKTLVHQFDFKSDDVISIGDGANDLLMLKESGLSISMHGKPILNDFVDWSIRQNYFLTLIKLFKFYEAR
ncbi:MAG: phosphoserine phosphatase SerB [Proteobacteria bacterium]|jgi:phosphoserine phosphatase|nr:phosphoserine phosphatase SerB [Pseudomonadota bacterium]MDA1034577.1 phosphoserine phosphatase SerB [Pseudomonadota bacterium]